MGLVRVNMVNSKHAFWQALIVTVAVFIIGLFLGIALEGKRSVEAEEKFISSELSLMDSFALSSLTKVSDNGQISCDVLVDSNVNFADRIYRDALLFEEYFQLKTLFTISSIQTTLIPSETNSCFLS